MNDQFTVLKRSFNSLHLRWSTAGKTAASIHASYMGIPYETPTQFDFIIGKHNQEKFYDMLVKLKYDFVSTKSGRKNLRFEKRGHVPVNIHLEDSSPSSMTYDGSTPLQKLEKLSNVKRLVNYKKKIQNVVKNLMRNVNLNVN
jgi:hypothetical protein